MPPAVQRTESSCLRLPPVPSPLIRLNSPNAEQRSLYVHAQRFQVVWRSDCDSISLIVSTRTFRNLSSKELIVNYHPDFNSQQHPTLRFFVVPSQKGMSGGGLFQNGQFSFAWSAQVSIAHPITSKAPAYMVFRA